MAINDQSPMFAQDVDPMQIQKFLTGVSYPATKEELIEIAREEGADDKVLSTLESIQEDNFESPNDVAEALNNSNTRNSDEGNLGVDDEDMLDDDVD